MFSQRGSPDIGKILPLLWDGDDGICCTVLSSILWALLGVNVAFLWDPEHLGFRQQDHDIIHRMPTSLNLTDQSVKSIYRVFPMCHALDGRSIPVNKISLPLWVWNERNKEIYRSTRPSTSTHIHTHIVVRTHAKMYGVLGMTNYLELVKPGFRS